MAARARRRPRVARHAASRRAPAGNGGLVVIEGRAGVGKTSLLAEARTIASEAGLQVLSARSSELEQDFAFGVVRQLFEPVLAATSEQTRGELLAGAGDLAAPLFEVTTIAEPPPGGDVSFADCTVSTGLPRTSRSSPPTALLIDDLHWCDGPSVRWLLHVVRRLEGLPLMVVVGTRPPQQARHACSSPSCCRIPPRRSCNRRSSARSRLRCSPASCSGQSPTSDSARRAMQVTGGNPLYLRALLSTLAAEGRAPTAENAARVRAIGPEPIARIVALRLSRLSSDAEELARAVAVLDGTADIAAGGRARRSRAGRGGDGAVRSRRCRDPPTRATSGVHPSDRPDVGLRALCRPERVLAHRHAARLLADSGAEPEQAAAHLLAVPAGGDGADVSVLRHAARRPSSAAMRAPRSRTFGEH